MDFSIKKIFTIPNIISFFRIILIPFIVLSIIKWDNTYLAVLLTAISAFTDVIDGKIARRFNMKSDLGKALDPVADKLTLIALFLSCSLKNHILLLAGAVLIIREIIMAVTGLVAAKSDKKFHSAVWHGKVCTVLLYCLIVVVMIFPEIPSWAVISAVVVCSVFMIFSLVMYVKDRVDIIKNN